MNGAPLTINHGYPLRAVIPGIAGARWTKWLDRITILPRESKNYYMQKDYKILPPHIETRKQADAYWHKVPALQMMPVNSVIACPSSGETIPTSKLPNGGELEISGYALPAGDDGPVVKVEISTNEGKSWEPADIVYPGAEEMNAENAEEKYRWSWAIWKYKLSADRTKRLTKATKIWSRATDKGGNIQKAEDIKWNYRGVGYNGFGEIEGLTIIDDQELAEKAGRMTIANGTNGH
jgi:sulfite oxidase